MRTIRSLAIYAAAAAVVVSAIAAASAGAPADRKKAAKEKERKLIAVIESNAPAKDKAIPCKQLAIYGSKDAVPALAALLPNRELQSWARIALEAIPDSAVDDALRKALGKLEGRLLIGAINSIGVRRDAKAVDALVAKAKDADTDVAAAAAEALGRIGGDQAAKALEQALPGAPAAVRSSVAYGCVLCAERFLAEGKAAQAVKLYDTVRKADVPKQRVVEATRGAILARGAAGVPLLVEQLKSPDKALFGVGLRTARELGGAEVSDALVAELAKAAPNRQVFLLIALADRGDAKALPAVLDSAKNGKGEVRFVAVGVLERLGNASCVPVVLAAALDSDAKLAGAAKGALARMSGKDVDADILARLPKASGKACQLLMEAAARRQISAAVPAMVRYAASADAGIRAAAVAAVGIIGETEQAADLVRILQKTADPKEYGGIEKALTAVSVRAGAPCVPQVMPLTRSDKGALRVIGLHALAAAGGPDALAALTAALKDTDQAVQDDAIRTLSNWPNKWPKDAGVTEPLLGLIKSGKKVSHRVLALRGYLRYVQGARDLKEADKLAKVQEVLPLTKRPEEKRLIISVLSNLRIVGALDALVALTDEAGVSEEACSAIVNLARRGDVRGASKDQRRKALQTAAEKAKSKGLKKRAQDRLKSIK